MADKMALSARELVDEVRAITVSQGYSPKYLKALHSVFDKFEDYCEAKGISQYTAEIGEQFLIQNYGIEPGTTSSKATPAQRVIAVLTEYQLIGVIVPRMRKHRDVMPPYRNAVNAYMDMLEKKEYKRPSTLQRIRGILIVFTEFLWQKGICDFNALDIETLNMFYTDCLKGYGRKYVQDHVNGVRRFLMYLFEEGMLKEDISKRVIKVECPYTPRHLPDTFTVEEIEKLLSTVDRDSPQGKRDYAILEIAARLGLRQGDIKNLKFENINWDKMEISFIQGKTGKGQELPLPKEVGWAIIDYIKDARPECGAKEIFVRCVPPYVPLTNYDYILTKHLRAAGISLKDKRHYGFHTLRHSLATNMLRDEIPVNIVQGVLGHESPDTTKRFYTAIDINQLDDCSMEVPDI